jgi:hypothetical protein
MTERKPPGMSFQSWIDSQIARGMARGDFDDLPGAGKPLPLRAGDESAYDWVVSWARRENVDVLGMLPPALALRKEREDLARRATGLPSEAAVRALVEDFNDRVQLYWRRPQDGPAVPVGLADADELVAEWARTRPAPPPPPPAAPPQSARRLSWLRRRRSEG